MDESIKAILYSIGSRLFNYGFGFLTAPGHNPVETRIQHLDRLIQSIPPGELTESPTTSTTSRNEGLLPATVSRTLPEENPSAFIVTTIREPRITDKQEDIATGCLPCALGHFSMSSGALSEAVRFKSKGIASNEILDRIAIALEQQNILEREDLSPEKIQHLPEWQRSVADEALSQSQQLRHKLEGIQGIDELEQLAADTKKYYIKLNRQWYKGRFRHLGAKKAEAIAQRVGEN